MSRIKGFGRLKVTFWKISCDAVSQFRLLACVDDFDDAD